jgi:hypothetical protein
MWGKSFGQNKLFPAAFRGTYRHNAFDTNLRDSSPQQDVAGKVNTAVLLSSLPKF